MLPLVTSGVAIICSLWAPARRWLWAAVALAAVNVVLTPLSSGEWSYQRAEDPAYERAVAGGDFTPFSDLVDQHDPQLVRRMLVTAMVLLLALVGLAVLRTRANRGAQSPVAATAIATAGVVLAAVATLVQSFPRLT